MSADDNNASTTNPEGKAGHCDECRICGEWGPHLQRIFGVKKEEELDGDTTRMAAVEEKEEEEEEPSLAARIAMTLSTVVSTREVAHQLAKVTSIRSSNNGAAQAISIFMQPPRSLSLCVCVCALVCLS